MTNDEFDRFLEPALKRYANAPQDDEASLTRVMKRLAAPLPRQKQPLWRLPAVLLDWQFAPAWPRMAALGACMVLGFAIGLSDVGNHLDWFDAASVTSSSSVGALVFEPEELTGAQP
jgi:hypothetical protein